MRTSTKKPLLLIACLLLSLTASAYDFAVNGIYYDINPEQDLTVTVTYKEKVSWNYINDATGDITIPSTVDYNSKTYTVTSIGANAFWRCSNVSSITLPVTLKSIGDGAFVGCERLSVVNIPDGVTSIGGSAFSECTKLVSIFIPSSVTHVGSQAFHYNPWYNNLPDGLTYTGLVAYKYVGSIPANVVIKEGTTQIASDAFVLEEFSANLISVSIPNSVTSIGGFSSCINLEAITLPNQLTTIDESAFMGCEKLTSVIIPNSVITIGTNAFSDCGSLTSVTIGEKVESIGYRAFQNCSGITSVTSLNPVAPMVDDPYSLGFFYDGVYSTATLNIPKGALASYQSADYWKNFVNTKETEAGGVESLGTAEVKITAVGNEIIVTGADDAAIVDVFNINGQLIYSGTEKTVKVPASGAYIVKTTGAAQKIII